MFRTHLCGQLQTTQIGTAVTLAGWVDTVRDHGGVLFVDLRDRSGKTQIVFHPEGDAAVYAAAQGLRNEYVIMVTGTVRARPAGTENPALSTGSIEVPAVTLEVLNVSQTPPFPIEDDTKVSEEVRYTYRFLDLRRPRMLKNLEVRSVVSNIMRNVLQKEGFLEVETPILTKSTPEGARDFLVPSRMSRGKFYALPQSPQLFKQLLMVAGCDRYFQIARCFRDEDLRADRQLEFTQLDMEMSFITQDDIFGVCERLMSEIFAKVSNVTVPVPFPRLTYAECMDRYGCDKPDTRFGMELVDVSAECANVEFKVFRTVLNAGGRIKCITVKGAAEFSRSKIDELIAFAVSAGAKGLAYFKVEQGKLVSQIDKFFSPEILSRIAQKAGAGEKDLLLFVADKPAVVAEVLSALRLRLAHERGLIPSGVFHLLWVVDFPLFKWNDEEKRLESEHHPFTSPRAEDIGKLDTEPLAVRSSSYDLVINGVEIGSGSIRIHNADLQNRIFNAIGLKKTEIAERFGFLLDAFTYGAPPHGGVAFGLDRLITLFVNTPTIRDVIAFPMTQRGINLMTQAPSPVAGAQLAELGITIKQEEEA